MKYRYLRNAASIQKEYQDEYHLMFDILPNVRPLYSDDWLHVMMETISRSEAFSRLSLRGRYFYRRNAQAYRFMEPYHQHLKEFLKL